MNCPLKIHFFVQFVHEQGTYFRFHNLGAALARRGHEVEVFGCDNIPSNPKRTETRDGVVYHIRPSFRGQGWFHPFNHPLNALYQIPAAMHRCDIAHLFQPFLTAAPAWMLARAKAKFYDWDDLWFGGMMSDNPTSFSARYFRGITGCLEKWLPRAADHVTTCSRFLSDLATSRGAKTTTVIHNGFNRPEGPAMTPQFARHSLGLKQDAFYLGFMGRTLKELDWCFDLLQASMDEHPNLRLALCGPDIGVLDDLHPDISARIDHLGSIPAGKIPAFASAIDLGLLPLEDSPFNRSRFPIKFAEYMLGETPVLASEVGECAELGRSMPWVTLSGIGKDSWISVGQEAIRSILNGRYPRVALDELLGIFTWDAIASTLERQYHDALDGTQMQPKTATDSL